MIWKNDRLRPTQPYLVFDTQNFCQEVYLKQGISHFYSCNIADGVPLRTVPDGCIDLFLNMKRIICRDMFVEHHWSICVNTGKAGKKYLEYVLCLEYSQN